MEDNLELIIEIGETGDFKIISPGKISEARHVMVENLVKSMSDLGVVTSRERNKKRDDKVIEVGHVHN